MRYIYGTYSTRTRAEESLEDDYATGAVSAGEKPRIEPRRDHRGRIIAWDYTLSCAGAE